MNIFIIALSTIVHAVYVYYSECMKSFMVYDGSCDLHISTSFSIFSPTEPGAEKIFAATIEPLHTALLYCAETSTANNFKWFECCDCKRKSTRVINLSVVERI